MKIDDSVREKKRKELAEKFINGVSEISPSFSEHFSRFWKDKKCDGAMQDKNRELLMLLAGLVDNCEPCVRFHMANAMKRGAAEAEIFETVSVAAVMCSDPSINDNIKKCLGIYEKFKKNLIK
ncbi:carboxymuconolactone decarboxylase family protein [bacterium]|nr:carboxymuconolactone decarboxylase family protein [bacterium]